MLRCYGDLDGESHGQNRRQNNRLAAYMTDDPTLGRERATEDHSPRSTGGEEERLAEPMVADDRHSQPLASRLRVLLLLALLSWLLVLAVTAGILEIF